MSYFKYLVVHRIDIVNVHIYWMAASMLRNMIINLYSEIYQK